MSRYRRWRQPGGTYFFTVVTHERRPILAGPEAIAWLREAMDNTRATRPFDLLAGVVLPDHIHCLWRLPNDDDDFPTRWRMIKTRFTRSMLARARQPARPGASRLRRGEHGVWQRRFWEHVIRDERDLKRHVDYIHYNPVRHGLVGKAADWPYSTFRKYVEMNEYPDDWGEAEPETIRDWAIRHE